MVKLLRSMTPSHARTYWAWVVKNRGYWRWKDDENYKEYMAKIIEIVT